MLSSPSPTVTAMRDEDNYPEELPRSDDSAVSSYQAHVERNVARQRGSFRSHLGSFLGVNAMLVVIWAVTGAGFPWFLIPLFGWGIGLSSHYGQRTSAEAEYRNLRLLGRVNRNVANLYRKLAKNRRSWTGHLVSTTATSMLLLVINGITWSGFPWALIPIAAMGIGLFSHFPTFRSKERRLLRQLAEEGVDVRRLERGTPLFRRRLLTSGGSSPSRHGSETAAGTPRRSASGSVPPAGPEQEAERLRESILANLGEEEKEIVGSDFREALDGFVSQVKRLTATREEIEQILSDIPTEALQRDLLALKKRRDAAESERMRKEYERSIDELERQESSYASLREDLEMIDLRTRSALNGLKQINIDLVRMRSATRGGEEGTAEELRSKSAELTRYLTDLHAAYEELE